MSTGQNNKHIFKVIGTILIIIGTKRSYLLLAVTDHKSQSQVTCLEVFGLANCYQLISNKRPVIQYPN